MKRILVVLNGISSVIRLLSIKMNLTSSTSQQITVDLHAATIISSLTLVYIPTLLFFHLFGAISFGRPLYCDIITVLRV